LELLERVLLEGCQLPIERDKFQSIVRANRFSQLTQGRERGQEDVYAHERKGIAGDWRNYFTDSIKTMFKHRYGGVLIATGCEHDFNW
jgi:lipopolysaccharide transport system ATP-binding protein